MTLTPLEKIALIMILISLVKIITILITPTAWNNIITKKIFKYPHALSFISFILALVVLYFLLKELTITQIIATTAFVSLLIAMGSALYYKEIQKLSRKLFKDKTLIKRSLIYILIWIVILLWGLKEIIF